MKAPNKVYFEAQGERSIPVNAIIIVAKKEMSTSPSLFSLLAAPHSRRGDPFLFSAHS